MPETVALAQERAILASRLLRDIERRHGLPQTPADDVSPVSTDRYLVVFVPDTHDGAPVPQRLEFAFTPSMADAVRLLGRVVDEVDQVPHGWGSACYVHDLNTGSALPESDEEYQDELIG